jgi:uncharacterized protein
VELLVEPGRCSVCRLDPSGPWPAPPAGARLYSVTQTTEERSVVCAEGDAPAGARVESGWRVLRLVGPLAFDLVGVVASVTVPLAAAGIGVFVLSTFDTDLVLVKAGDLDRAVQALEGAGHRVTTADA